MLFRSRADELIAQGYTGYLSGHTHHPELRAHGDGFYGNTGSCTSVVEAIETVYGMPPVYLRTQQLSWLEVTATPPFTIAEQGQDEAALRARATLTWHATLKSARVELPGATRFERFLVRSRNPHSTAPKVVAMWPEGPYWPADRRHLKHRHVRHNLKHAHLRHGHLKRARRASADEGDC